MLKTVFSPHCLKVVILLCPDAASMTVAVRVALARVWGLVLVRNFRTGQTIAMIPWHHCEVIEFRPHLVDGGINLECVNAIRG